jgi:U2-associated protein SR140
MFDLTVWLQKVREADLRDIFSPFGSISSIKIMKPRTEEESRRSRISGFVCFETRRSAENAFNSLQNYVFEGRLLKVEWGRSVNSSDGSRNFRRIQVFVPQNPKLKESLDRMAMNNSSGQRVVLWLQSLC